MIDWQFMLYERNVWMSFLDSFNKYIIMTILTTHAIIIINVFTGIYDKTGILSK